MNSLANQCFTSMKQSLFQYNQVLYGIGQQQFERFRPFNDKWNRASSWPFCFRFPSITESRRTVNYKDIVDGEWINSRHAMPPSFDTTSDTDDLSFYASSPITTSDEAYSECKIEYALTAKVLVAGRKPKVLKLPIQFMPFSTTVGLSSHPLSTPQNQLAALDQMAVSVRPLDFSQSSWSPISGLTIRPPTDIRIGQTFTISGVLMLHRE